MKKKNSIVEESITPSDTTAEIQAHAPVSRTESPSVVTEAAEMAPAFPPEEKKDSIAEESITPSDTTEEIQAHGLDEDGDLNRESQRESIVAILKGHADGMKMVQLAELMDIENWRSLIPVMRELLDERILEKDGSVYFISRPQLGSSAYADPILEKDGSVYFINPT